MYATNYFENAVLNVLRGQSASAPSAVYIGLYHSNPGETGAAGTEVAYAGYQRKAISFTAPAPISGALGIQNSSEITFSMAPNSQQAITHVGVLDSVTGGNMLLYGQFDEHMQILANESPVIVAGEAQWWITGSFSTAFKTKVLNFVRGASLTGVTPYVALYNGDPESGGLELSGSGYARQAVTFAAPAEQGGGQSQIASAATVTFPRALTPWGTWSYTALVDAISSGALIDFGARPGGAREARKGLRVIINAGDYKVSMH